MPVVEAVAPEYEIYEADIYRARVAGVDVENRQPDQYNPKPYIQFVVSVVLAIEGEGGKSYKCYLKNATGPGSNLNKFVAAIGLEPYEAGDQIDTDDWMSRWFRINLDDKKKDGTPGNRVLGYLPLKGKSKAAPPVIEDVEVVPPSPPARPERTARRAPTPPPPDDDDMDDVPF